MVGQEGRPPSWLRRPPGKATAGRVSVEARRVPAADGAAAVTLIFTGGDAAAREAAIAALLASLPAPATPLVGVLAALLEAPPQEPQALVPEPVEPPPSLLPEDPYERLFPLGPLA